MEQLSMNFPEPTVISEQVVKKTIPVVGGKDVNIIKTYDDNFLMSRYYLQDEATENMSVEEVRDILRKVLPVVTVCKRDTLDSIYEAVVFIQAAGLSVMSESSKFYVDFDAENKVSVPAFKVEDGIFELFAMKYTLPYLDWKTYDRNKLIVMLKFFRFISDGMNNIDEVMIENVLTYKKLYEDLKESTVKESDFAYSNDILANLSKEQHSFSMSFLSIIDGKSGINAKVDGTYINKFGNIMNKIVLTLKGKSGDAEFDIYVPMMVDGIYTLGMNRFIQTKLVEKFVANKPTNILHRLINMVVKSSLFITKAYYINKGNHKIIQHSLQSGINSLFFTRRNLSMTKKDAEMVAAMLPYEVNPEQMIKDSEYSFSPFIFISNQSESLTAFEELVEHYKLYYKEYVSVGKYSGENIAKLIGVKGYEKYHNFAMNNKEITLFDPTFVNSKANYQVAWTNKNKISLSSILDPFNIFNYKSLRNAMGPYVAGHAFKLKDIKPQRPFTLTKENLDVMPPRYNMWFLFTDYQDDYGLSTHDGVRLLYKGGHLDDALYEGIKLATNGLDKGICRMTDDKLYFMHKGKKIYLNIMSPLNIASRQNFGVLFEAMHNGYKALNGLVPSVRDFNETPLQKNELLDFQEIFKETVDGDIPFGKHPIGLVSAYFVHDIDSTYKGEDELEASERSEFKKYNLGNEFMVRLALMGDTRITRYLLGTEEDMTRKIHRIIDNSVGNVYGKRGKIVKTVYQKEVIGFSSTASANAKMPQNEARIYLPDFEFELFLKGMSKIEKNFDLEGAKENFYNNRYIELPPALQLRNPSIDDANTIYVKVFLYRAVGKYVKYGYCEVNPITWARQGGDFDGDQAIFDFFPFFLRKDLHKLFDYKIHDYKLGYDTKIRELHKMDKKYYNLDLVANNYSDLTEFIAFIVSMKKDIYEVRPTLDTVFNEDGTIRHQTVRQMVVSCSSNVLTTRISKQLIGVSKTITMKALFFIENAMNFYGITDLALMTKLRKLADTMNNKLVQPTIDIQKWSDDLNSVVKLVLMVNRMSTAVAYGIESHFYPNEFAYNSIIRKLKSIGCLKAIKEDDEYVYQVVREQNGKFNYDKLSKLDNLLLNIAETSLYLGGDFVQPYDVDDAGWNSKVSDPRKFIENMMAIIDIKGETFKTVESLTEQEMKSIDANKLFFAIGKE